MVGMEKQIVELPDKRLAVYDGQYNEQNWFIVYTNGVQDGRFSEAQINTSFHNMKVMERVKESGTS